MSKIICMDVDSGLGGSSRSLLEAVRYLHGRDFEIEIWRTQRGPLDTEYDRLGIKYRLVGAFPRFKAVPRFSRNVISLIQLFMVGRKSRALLRELASAAQAADLVHFNTEACFWMAKWLRARTSTPITCHVRGYLASNAFGKWQARALFEYTDNLVFISKNEQRHLMALAGKAGGTIIHNIVKVPDAPVARHLRIPDDGRYVVCCVGTYAWNKGQDLLVDIAEVLARRGRRDFLFVVAGRMVLPTSLPGEFGQMARELGTFEAIVAKKNLADMFLFLGHVDQPQTVYAASDAMVKPSRERCPWSRDVLEAMAYGLPVITSGDDETFIEDGVSGRLFDVFDADAFADALLACRADSQTAAAMGAEGQRRITALCDGEAQAQKLADVWRGAMGGRAQSGQTAKPAA